MGEPVAGAAPAGVGADPSLRDIITPAHRRFRSALRELLDSAEFRSLLARCRLATDDCDPRPLYRMLGGRGWLAPEWPRRYGGIDGDPVHTGILTEELAHYGVPDSAHVNSVRNAGAFVLSAGTAQQRERVLPSLASGQNVMAVLYSEPAAGSDLAGLATRATKGPAGWVIDGTKIYSVKTGAARYGLLAARTSDHEHKLYGLTLFIVDLSAPGVEVRPISTLNIEPFYEVVLDQVQVGHEAVIGEPDSGWFYVIEALAIERVGLDFNAKVRSWLAAVRSAVAAGPVDPAIVYRLRELEVLAAAGRSLAWRMVHRLARQQLDPAQAAESKWFNSELGQRVADLALAVEGPASLLADTALREPAGEPVPTARAFLREAPGLTLSAGTSEIMLYVIATHLGLWGDDEH